MGTRLHHIRPRRTTFVLVFALIMAALAPSVAATGCTVPQSGPASQLPLPVGSFDQNMFSTEVLLQVNYHRCLQGVGPVGGHQGLTDVAATHAEWMAATRKLSHHSTIPGQSDVAARVRVAVTAPRVGSENIGYVHRYRIDEGEPFFASGQNCAFTTRAGRAIATHSYASLAKRIVQLWMESPGHRVNVLDRNISVAGTAVAFDDNAPHCGVYYMSQNFAG